MKRIFIALQIVAGENLLNMISDLKAGLRKENIKWTPVENLHITLAFMGDTQEEKIENISHMLTGICETSGKFEMQIRGAGVFKGFSNPRVIWTGIGASEELNRLGLSVKDGLKETGILIEDRPFNPHLTLGRVRNVRDKEVLRSLISRYNNAFIQQQEIKEVVLYESILLQKGPLYKPVGVFKLGQKAG
jgi:RNA 2',3'-cyclic 3'-phosphodiesterase